nr:hypothetical protein [Brevibacillus laterosporus]
MSKICFEELRLESDHMKQMLHTWMASKEVAEKLDLHVRTLRNWLDLFVPTSQRQKNPQGHYLISTDGFTLLQEAKKRKDSGNSSLKEIQRDMLEEGILPVEILDNEVAANGETQVSGSKALPSQPLTNALREVEITVQDTLLQFQKEISQLSTLPQLQASILEKIAEIEEKQEALRLEMRRVTFEMDLMHQRLTRRKQRSNRYESRWSLNPFRWFTRSNNHSVISE